MIHVDGLSWTVGKGRRMGGPRQPSCCCHVHTRTRTHAHHPCWPPTAPPPPPSAGFSLAGGAVWASATFLLAFLLYRATVVPAEERMLREAYGDEYDKYA